VDPIELTENGPSVVRRLTEHQGALLEASRVVDARRLGDGAWELTAGSKVGATRIGDLVVRIHPKIPIHRLLFLLGYARNPGWHTSPVPFDPAPDLVAALAFAFARHAEHATDQGLLQGYVETDDTLTVLRGRLREQDQLRQRFGQVLPLLVRYDDYTTDIAENRLLRAAAQRLLRVPLLEPKARRRLQGLLATLVDITPLIRGRPLPTWTRSRLNVRYHPALDLAELILRDNAVDLPTGDVTMDGFLVDMWQVFEDFVTTALTEALKPAGGTCQKQDAAHHLDDASKVRLVPPRPPGRCRRCQVQGREVRWLPRRRPLPTPRLLHRPQPRHRPPRLRQGQRTGNHPPHRQLGHLDRPAHPRPQHGTSRASGSSCPARRPHQRGRRPCWGPWPVTNPPSRPPRDVGT
jgi:5-methylcytosine-specific restriction enzyme subunit McrC